MEHRTFYPDHGCKGQAPQLGSQSRALVLFIAGLMEGCGVCCHNLLPTLAGKTVPCLTL